MNNTIIKNIKQNFFKVFIEWANGQYDLIKHSTFEFALDLQYDILDTQPINSVFMIGKQSMHRLFLPTNEKIINYEFQLESTEDKSLPIQGDFDIFVSLIEGDLKETITAQELKLNLVYIIPAGQYFNFSTSNNAKYYLSIRKRDSVVPNPNPNEIKCVNFEDQK